MPRTVIDADGHVFEPKDLFERYVDVPLGALFGLASVGPQQVKASVAS
jgi:hypothetical protein